MMPASLFADALARHQAGRLDEAEALYLRVLADEPRHADSRHLLGVIAFQRGHHADAAARIGEAIALNAGAASYHANLGLVLEAQGKLREALAAQEQALALMPDYPEAQNNKGLVLQALGRLDEAAACYRKAIALRPAMPEPHNNLGNVLEEQGLLAEALASCRQALALKPHYPEALNSIGIILDRQGQADAAIASHRDALALKPDYIEAWNNLGHVLKAQGRFEEATTAYQTALTFGGDPSFAWHGLSDCRKYTAADRSLTEEILEASKTARSNTARSLMHFALGKMFDDMGDCPAAMAQFDAGNNVEGKKHRFDRQALTASVDRLIEDFRRQALQSQVASASQLPILIVGLPRSGTTLTEQILASHPNVTAGGELNFWLERSVSLRKGPAPAEDRSAIADYLALLESIGPGADHVTDKMPYNFFNAGLVHRLFPNARIIHCRRNPVDTALSIYFSRFARAHDFAYDRDDIVFYIRQYQRLMAHWRRVLPAERYLELDYESLIADQQSVSRTLISFCGLEWDDACLSFFKTERSIGTLSAWQVRQPLYRSSVERWRHYEPWLGSLAQLFNVP